VTTKVAQNAAKTAAKAAANANANLCLADGCIGLLERMQESANAERVKMIERQLRALIQDELAAYDRALATIQCRSTP